MKSYLLIALGIAVVLGFQNCSDKSFSGTAFSIDDIRTDGSQTPPTRTPTPDEVEEAKATCLQVLQDGTFKTLSQEIVFEDTKVETGRDHVCRFGEGGNLDQSNTFMRARYEQQQTLNLPANAVICDLDMSNSLQQFKYDDVFFLTYNDRILATNNVTGLRENTNISDNIKVNGKNIGVYVYDWLKIRNGSFENVARDYCLGLQQGFANCTWPVTEQNGNITFDFDQELLINLGLRSIDKQTFKFVMTGDNDPEKDCYHERLAFSLNVKYYIK